MTDDLTSSWVKDGTAETEPVTTETPPEPTTQEPEAVSRETPEATDTVSQEETVAEGFVGRVGEEDFTIPKGFTVPVRRGDEIEYVPIEDLQGRSMMEKDYRTKTNEINQSKRSLLNRERALAENRAASDARETHLAEMEEQLKQSFTDPDKHAAYQEHLRQYEENPVYRQNVDDALAKRQTDAKLKVFEDERQQSQLEEGVATVQGWADELHEAHPGVPIDRALAIYGERLERAGANGRLDKQDLEAIFVSEEGYLNTAMSPLQQQLANLTQQVEQLSANDDAGEHNTATAHAMNRGKVPRVNSTTNSPSPHKKTKPKRHTMEEHQGVVDRWARGE